MQLHGLPAATSAELFLRGCLLGSLLVHSSLAEELLHPAVSLAAQHCHDHHQHGLASWPSTWGNTAKATCSRYCSVAFVLVLVVWKSLALSVTGGLHPTGRSALEPSTRPGRCILVAGRASRMIEDNHVQSNVVDTNQCISSFNRQREAFGLSIRLTLPRVDLSVKWLHLVRAITNKSHNCLPVLKCSPNRIFAQDHAGMLCVKLGYRNIKPTPLCLSANLDISVCTNSNDLFQRSRV